MRRIAPLLVTRPDLSWLFATYLRRFPEDKEAADILLRALKKDPTYDASAANYIGAMDVCEPKVRIKGYRSVIQTAERRSEEKGILLKIASATFRGRRSGPKDAVRIVQGLKDPLAQSIAIHYLFGHGSGATYVVNQGVPLLDEGTKSADADLARFCGELLLDILPWTKHTWRPNRHIHRSMKLLMKAIGLRTKAPKKKGILEKFFQDKMGIGTAISWKKVLQTDWIHVERRCLRLQELEVGDPGSWVLILDTFNELLLQTFSKRHSKLNAAYKKATPKASTQPDYGNWLNHPLVAATLPKGISWFRGVHSERVKADLAHAKSKKGRVTKRVTFQKRERLSKGAQIPWAELIGELKKVT